MKDEKNVTLRYFVVGIVVAATIVAGFVYFTQNPKTEIDIKDESVLSGNIIEGNATITEEEVVQAPDFTRPLSFGAGMDTDIRTLLQRKFDDLQAVLKENPLSFNAWVEIGTLRKTTGDYAGAAEDWHYIAKVYPNSTVPFDNLGDLYMNFIKNYPQAEENFKASIAFSPGNIHAYQQLFSLYTIYGYKADTSAAADLIAKGLAANPGNETLLQLKQQLETGSSQ